MAASVIGCAVAAAGCGGAQLQEMQNQVNAQQAQIEKQAREIAELNAQQNVATTLPPPGNCDDDVMHKALAHGDDQYAQGKYNLALGYYQDAGVACPGEPAGRDQPWRELTKSWAIRRKPRVIIRRRATATAATP